MTSVTLVGATGLTGKSTLHSLLRSSTPLHLTTLTRRDLPAPTEPASASSSYTNRVFPDLFDAAKDPDAFGPPSASASSSGGGDTTLVSCLGTTRAAAGGVDKQKIVDVDLGLALATAAKERGVEHCVVVSSAGNNKPDAWVPYSRMKGQLEEGLKETGFKSLVILRPGMLLGDREVHHKGFGEALGQKMFRGLRSAGAPVGAMCVDATDVGDCIAHFVAHPPAEPVTYVSNSEIVSIAREHRASP